MSRLCKLAHATILKSLIISLLEALDDYDDVQEVYSNADL